MSDTTPFYTACLNRLQKQYQYTNVAKFCLGKAEIWDDFIGDITKRFSDEVLNLDTCSSSALDYFWGRIFHITRTFYIDDVLTTLTDDQFREILKIKAFKTHWDGSISSLNTFLMSIFSDRGKCYVVDMQNMSAMIYAIDFELEAWESYLFDNYDILPRCAGVGISVNIQPVTQKYFGYREYENVVVNPISVTYREYGIAEPDGKYYEYGDLD